MKLHSIEGAEIGNIELPEQFKESYHPDLIKRAVIAVQANKRQRYGSFAEAGKRASVVISKRRRDYRTSYGHGISRAPRKVVWRRGRQFGWVGANAPGTTKGRKAHPPKAEKDFSVRINNKELKKAIRSALSATLSHEIVKQRNHILPQIFPLLIESKIESINKTKEIMTILAKLGLTNELARATIKKIRAGKGKHRGRPYRKKTSLLIVVSEKCPLAKSAKNIPGVDIALVDKLNAELLAPGTHAGRLTLYTDKSITRLQKEKLYA